VLLAAMMLVVPLIFTFRTIEVARHIKFLVIRLTMFTAFSLWLLGSAHERRFSLRVPRLNLPVVVYGAACTLASLFAFNRAYSLAVLHDLLWCMVIFVVVANSKFDEKSFVSVAGAIVCAAFLAASFGVLQRFNLAFNEWYAPPGEPIGTPSSFGHRNFAAEYMAASAPFAVALFLRVRSYLWKIAALLGVLVILFHLFLAGSRASLIGLISAALFCVVITSVSFLRKLSRSSADKFVDLVRKSARRWEFQVLVGCAVVFFLLAPFLLRPDFREFIRDAQTTLSLERESNLVRLATWQSSADLAVANPLVGVGPGNYEVFLPEHWNMVDKVRYARKNMVSNRAHNAYLQIACDAGFLGLGSFVWIIAAALVVGVRLAWLLHLSTGFSHST